jgi:asparagine synthase (glutamine-hydrolysing)
LLKQLGKKLVPDTIWKRYKRPYRAPIQRSFFTQNPPAYVTDLFTEEALRDSGYFNPEAVTSLVSKAQSGAKLSEVDDMALVGVLSTQLVHQQFVSHFTLAQTKPAHLKVVEH